jgi:hypothetical protein
MTSFPFLKIAREHNVPYGVVLRIAEALKEGRGPNLDPETGFDFYQHPILVNDVAAAIVDERERRDRVSKEAS